jgi:hypothetical protein
VFDIACLIRKFQELEKEHLGTTFEVYLRWNSETTLHNHVLFELPDFPFLVKLKDSSCDSRIAQSESSLAFLQPTNHILYTRNQFTDLFLQ